MSGARDWALLALGVAALAALPLVADNYTLRLGTVFCMYAALALSWNVIGGFAGYPSFATAAFFGLGAYTCAILQSVGWPVLPALAAGGVLAALFAAAVGGAILHLRGHYFAIASLALAEVLRELATKLEWLTGGGMGLNLPVPRMELDAQAAFFLHLMLGVAALAGAATLLLRGSRLGFALRCIQQNEDAAGMLGVDTRRAKTLAFAISAIFPGLAGGAYASWTHYIEPPDVFDVLLSVKPLVMVLLGGLGTAFGPVIGAALLLLFEEAVWRSFLTLHAAVLGVIIVLLVLFLPNGLMDATRRLLGRRGRGAA